MKKYIVLPILGLMLVYGCSKKEEVKETKEEKFCIDKDLKEKITIEPIQKRAVSESINLTGNITYNGDHVVQFNSLVEGIITKTTFSLGDYVKKGQVLATIKSTDVADFEKQSIDSKSDLLVAKNNLKVAQELFDGKLNSESDVLQAKSEVNKAQSQLSKVQETYKIYNIKAGSIYEVTAPISGFIGQRAARPGQPT